MDDVDTRDDAMVERRCTRCGRPFFCGAGSAQGCWCAALPPLEVTRYTPEAGCLCRQCLQAAIERA